MLGLLKSLFHTVTDVRGLIHWGGTLGVCVIVFIETGFFVGFFLPGDSLLVTAGVFAAAHVLNLGPLLGLTILCAIAGDQVGYWIGRTAGHTLYRREDSFFFKRRHLQAAHDFYQKYGGKTVILARYVPIVRTFCPPVAGAAEMNYGQYFIYDVLGGTLWVSAMILGGYFLGSVIPNIEQRIHYVIIAVVILSLLPAFIGIYRARRATQSQPQASASTITPSTPPVPTPQPDED